MRKMKQQSQEDRERWNSISKEDEAEEYSTSTEARVTTEAQVNAQASHQRQDLLFHHSEAG
jgi:hypothetical protein